MIMTETSGLKIGRIYRLEHFVVFKEKPRQRGESCTIVVPAMNPFSPFGMPGFDPSKMDPKLLMELSQLVQQLPPEQLSRMQALMHNAMAGFDIRKEMEEFEKSLPPGFKQKIVALMAGSSPQDFAKSAELSSSSQISQGPTASVNAEGQPLNQEVSHPLDVREARLTILQAVADGQMSPSEAEKVLFS